MIVSGGDKGAKRPPGYKVISPEVQDAAAPAGNPRGPQNTQDTDAFILRMLAQGPCAVIAYWNKDELDDSLKDIQAARADRLDHDDYNLPVIAVPMNSAHETAKWAERTGTTAGGVLLFEGTNGADAAPRISYVAPREASANTLDPEIFNDVIAPAPVKFSVDVVAALPPEKDLTASYNVAVTAEPEPVPYYTAPPSAPTPPPKPFDGNGTVAVDYFIRTGLAPRYSLAEFSEQDAGDIKKLMKQKGFDSPEDYLQDLINKQFQEKGCSSVVVVFGKDDRDSASRINMNVVDRGFGGAKGYGFTQVIMIDTKSDLGRLFSGEGKPGDIQLHKGPDDKHPKTWKGFDEVSVDPLRSANIDKFETFVSEFKSAIQENGPKEPALAAAAPAPVVRPGF